MHLAEMVAVHDENINQLGANLLFYYFIMVHVRQTWASLFINKPQAPFLHLLLYTEYRSSLLAHSAFSIILKKYIWLISWHWLKQADLIQFEFKKTIIL